MCIVSVAVISLLAISTSTFFSNSVGVSANLLQNLCEINDLEAPELNNTYAYIELTVIVPATTSVSSLAFSTVSWKPLVIAFAGGALIYAAGGISPTGFARCGHVRAR